MGGHPFTTKLNAAKMTNLPHPENQSSTHWEDCYRTRGHHNCCAQKVDELQRELQQERERGERLTEALIEAKYPNETESTWPNMTCPVCRTRIDWTEVEDVPAAHKCPSCEAEFISELVFRTWQAHKTLEE